ncbi:hypothetical protein P7K49_036099 [Saguinus oedipus]|uniref:Nuclear pore complex interacting protein N-terminal domain-containing protein n=1 Tax=Saguinus oedipus TaxID=9490 RepID=A0ABQ9TPG4_SAGOE|nr:hypothetical protein P7K49_036099 [Saguinus oedipus]
MFRREEQLVFSSSTQWTQYLPLCLLSPPPLGPGTSGTPVGALRSLHSQAAGVMIKTQPKGLFTITLGTVGRWGQYDSVLAEDRENSIEQTVSTLPDDQPGPDFYGLPWKPVLITAFLGIASVAVFSWRTILVVKSRVYQVTEQQISEKLKIIRKENTELEQKLSNYEQKYSGSI